MEQSTARIAESSYTLLKARSPDEEQHMTEGYPLFKFLDSFPSSAREVPRRGV